MFFEIFLQLFGIVEYIFSAKNINECSADNLTIRKLVLCFFYFSLAIFCIQIDVVFKI